MKKLFFKLTVTSLILGFIVFGRLDTLINAYSKGGIWTAAKQGIEIFREDLKKLLKEIGNNYGTTINIKIGGIIYE